MFRTWINAAALLMLLCTIACGGDEGSSPVVSNGTTSNGTTGSSNGTTATSNGTTATSNGTTSNGTTATSNGTTATSNGTTGADVGLDVADDVGEDAADVSDEMDTNEPDVEDVGGDVDRDTRNDVGEEVGEDADTNMPNDTEGDVSDDDVGEDAGDDVGEDVAPDVQPDMPIGGDAGMDDAGDDGGNQAAFEESCLYNVIGQCYDGSQDILSCTINSGTDQIDVAYDRQRALRQTIDDDENFRWDYYWQGGEPCFSAVSLDDQPSGWVFAAAGDEATITVAYEGESVMITCADATQETWARDIVDSAIPSLFSEDTPECEALQGSECVNNSGCSDGFDVCCEAAGLGRCLDELSCPIIPAPPSELGDTCLAEMLECFGTQHAVMSCNINDNNGLADYTYTDGRSASLFSDGFGDYTLTTANPSDRGLCYSASFRGREGPWLVMDFQDPSNGDRHMVQFAEGEAVVTCQDETVDVLETDTLLQFIPPFLDGDDPRCEVETLASCGSDDDCDVGACCNAEEGRRCVPLLACPPPDNRWEQSCLFGTFECFGAEPSLDACVDYGDVDYTEASYADGVSAVFTRQDGRPSIDTAFGQFGCYSLVETNAGFEVISSLSGESFEVTIGGGESLIICPDDSSQSVPTDTMLEYVPERPSANLCSDPNPAHECDVADDCGGGLFCCDGGDKRVCAQNCDLAAPHTLCDSAEQCGAEQECCALPSVRVCDVAVCGNEVCCFTAEADVCDAELVCDLGRLCDPNNPDACAGEEACCQGTDSDNFVCRTEQFCRGWEPPVCESVDDCAGLSGGDWQCCPQEGGLSTCFDVVQSNGMCPEIGDRCTDDSGCDTEGGEVCCGQPGERSCVDALSCEDTCLSDTECPGALICCRDSNQCSRSEDCSTAGLCQVDDDCAPNGICCHAGPEPRCTSFDNCPFPCSGNQDCGDDRICCGSPASPFGAHCATAEECIDVEPRSCTVSSECGDESDFICCRTLDEPACLPIFPAEGEVGCTEACAVDQDCSVDGWVCCPGLGRTPTCAPPEACTFRAVGDPCNTATDCGPEGSGFACCAYDDLGPRCIIESEAERLCGQDIPVQGCADAPEFCGLVFPGAVCCDVEGVAVCASPSNCDVPAFDLCSRDVDCGPAGYRCCNNEVNPECTSWRVGECCPNSTCGSDDDCPGASVCCETQGNICVQPDRCQ